MSWLVETLLLNREKIRSKSDIESDEFHDLLLVESKITYLLEIGNIDAFELSIINFVISNKPYTELEKVLSISRNTIARYFRKICDKVSYALGGYYTDEGYLNYIKGNRKLTDEQVEKMRKHMDSRYRHTIRR